MITCYIYLGGFSILIGIIFCIIIHLIISIIDAILSLNPFNKIIWNYSIISIEKKSTIRMGTCRDRLKAIESIQKSSLYQNINLLTYNPGYTFNQYFDETGKKMKRGVVTVPPRLSIYAGNVEYQVGNDKSSQAELLWLGKELSDFLGLEMQTLYPTPKVPPETTGCGW